MLLLLLLFRIHSIIICEGYPPCVWSCGPSTRLFVNLLVSPPALAAASNLLFWLVPQDNKDEESTEARLIICLFSAVYIIIRQQKRLPLESTTDTEDHSGRWRTEEFWIISTAAALFLNSNY